MTKLVVKNDGYITIIFLFLYIVHKLIFPKVFADEESKLEIRSYIFYGYILRFPPVGG